MAVLTRGLNTVRAEFNTTFEDRDKASDGWIGNLAHQSYPSGHNPDRTGKAEYRDGDSLDEVRAIDVDKDLRSVVTMEQVVQHIIRRARAGVYVPFRYIIYKGRIWHRSSGWVTRTYTGANGHYEHAHFSGDYTQKADEWTGSLGLASLLPGEDDMNAAETTAWARSAAGSDAIGDAVMNAPVGNSGETLGVAIQRSRVTDKLIPQIFALASQDETVNVGELATALAPAIANIVVPALIKVVGENAGIPLTKRQVTEAVLDALRQGTGV